jgi:hypothetical protein
MLPLPELAVEAGMETAKLMSDMGLYVAEAAETVDPTHAVGLESVVVTYHIHKVRYSRYSWC